MANRNIDIRIPDLRGRRAMVTGGSDGIGLRIATRLAAAGVELLLPVRSREKAGRAIETIREAAPTASIVVHDLDLASLDSVAALGDTLRADGTPIDILVNNAGVMAPPSRQLTVDGHELQFAVNHLGHVALVAELFPLLLAGRARVTSQVSVAVARGSINWNDLASARAYDAMAAYRQSKIAFGLFALELARRSETRGWGITSTLSHPGVAPTSLLAARPELGRDSDTAEVRVIRWLSARRILVGTPATAALPALFAATSPEAGSGRLYGPRGLGHVGGPPAEQRLYPTLRSEQERRRVWEESEKLARTLLPSA